MKINIVLGVILLFAGYGTCKNFMKKSETDPTATVQKTQEPERTGPYGWKASHIVDDYQPDTAATRQIKAPPRLVNVPIDALPPASASRRAYLSEGWWHMNMAFQPSDTSVHHNYQSKWLRFRADQTFDIVIGGKVADSGRWNWDENKNELYLSCRDPYINNTWNTHASGSVMILKGNTAINVTGIQVRVVQSKMEPDWNN